MKTCTRCKQELSLDAFLNSSNGRGLYGKRSQCRECQNEYKRQLRINAPKDGIKICTACRKTKPIIEFYRESNKSGRAKTCKDCRLQKIKDNPRKKTVVDRALINSKAREKYSTDEYYRQRVLESSRRWRKRNRDKCNTQSKEWYRQNPHKGSEYHARYRARKSSNGGDFTNKEFLALCSEYDNRCLVCGENNPLTADHIVPVSMGGSNDINNIQPLCQSCNSTKWTQTIDYRR